MARWEAATPHRDERGHPRYFFFFFAAFFFFAM
jgi:hypothetical protein